jgi:hypothetical protein
MCGLHTHQHICVYTIQYNLQCQMHLPASSKLCTKLAHVACWCAAQLEVTWGTVTKTTGKTSPAPALKQDVLPAQRVSDVLFARQKQQWWLPYLLASAGGPVSPTLVPFLRQQQWLHTILPGECLSS